MGKFKSGRARRSVHKKPIPNTAKHKVKLSKFKDEQEENKATKRNIREVKLQFNS